MVSLKATIDVLDLIQSGYCNDIDEMNFIFWTVTNAGGMSDQDLVTMLDKFRKLHAANIDQDVNLQSHTIEQPYQSREAILDRLEKKLYKDAMALNTYDLASGAVTATQIIAAYEPLNEKLDLHEEQLSESLERLLEVADVDDEATYTRALIVNQSEMIDNYLNAASYLDDEYVTEKVMTVLGDKDQVKTVLKRRATKDIQRLTGGNNPNSDTGEGDGNTEGEQTV